MIKVTIPDYPDKIMTAKARRPIYYISSSSNVKGRTNIPKSFLNKLKYDFDNRGVLINLKTGLPQLANPQTAGKPRYWVVNFQDIWNQNLTKQDRAMKIDKLKSFLRPYIQSISPITQFPVEIGIMMYDTQCPVDVSNRGAIYTKVIEDLLVKEGKLPDDSIDYVNAGRVKFISISDVKDKKMIIKISKSDNNSF